MNEYPTDFTKIIAEKVLSHKQHLIELRTASGLNQLSESLDMSLFQWREHIIEIYANSIASDLETSFNDLKEWGQNAVNTLVNHNLPLEIALIEVRGYRHLIGKIIRDEAKNYNMTLDNFYEIISNFDSVVDQAVHWLSISYTKAFYTRINAAEATALELSIPIIKVSDKVGVLPLVGDIDTQRAHLIMEKTLTRGNKLSLNHLIIDLSGVPIIDTMVADRIFKVIDSLRLIGISTTLTGIRPEIAQVMVQLGINLSTITVESDLQSALEKII
ncbi:STAS domain-containing protein [Bacillus infantis]|uniref:STAS domain-containing protein n=1 Tax=Bacillus infantis TaxID=324767 RepID=UPI001CD75D3E|nr:STAS domain-containing protein [Bacillus infantis]MCA1037523.1 STAS domain-containing protein [Bacillus infantis]HER2025578.1 STAS domain-containing protein [Streptococcus pyogenes]